MMEKWESEVAGSHFDTIPLTQKKIKIGIKSQVPGIETIGYRISMGIQASPSPTERPTMRVRMGKKMEEISINEYTANNPARGNEGTQKEGTSWSRYLRHMMQKAKVKKLQRTLQRKKRAGGSLYGCLR